MTMVLLCGGKGKKSEGKGSGGDKSGKSERSALLPELGLIQLAGDAGLRWGCGWLQPSPCCYCYC